MPKTHKSIRIFQNPFLERLSHVHPITPLILWGPPAIWLIWRSFFVHELNFFQVAGIGFLALVSWTLVEYSMHRFLFHLEGDGPLSRRIHFLIHGIHHTDPQDPTRLVMPPTASIAFALVLFPMFRALLGPVWVEPFFGFFLLGYLAYDYIHFAVHHFTPKTRMGRYLKHSHMQHHYVCPESRWGVSSPLWDYVFGTLEGSVSSRGEIDPKAM
jgi:dihydroceramide fatty acyl 2-hydroxylase